MDTLQGRYFFGTFFFAISSNFNCDFNYDDLSGAHAATSNHARIRRPHGENRTLFTIILINLLPHYFIENKSRSSFSSNKSLQYYSDGLTEQLLIYRDWVVNSLSF